MNKLRKFLVIGVMVMTVFATMGVIAPNVQAAASAGDLIKMDGLTSVYFLGADGKRYVFPNEATYMSWYNDFSGVVTIPAAELQSYPLGGNVVMRPGTKLVKITTDPTVYAVEPNGNLRSIVSEANAIALYGTDWNKRVVDVPDAFFTNYKIGSALTPGQAPAGSLVKTADSADVYYYDGTNYRAFTNEAAFNANRFSFSNVITVSNVVSGGTAISSAEYVDVAQGGTTTGPVVTGSGLMVSLSAATPVSASVPKTSGRIPFTKVNLTAANDGAVNVSSVTVKRSGLTNLEGTGASFKVFIEKDGVIVASSKKLNASDEAILTFNPTLTIPAGQTVSLDIMADVNNVGGNGALGIVSASAISASSAAVTGSFPVIGNLLSFADYEVSELSLQKSGSAISVSVGDENKTLGSFTISNVIRDTKLTSLVFKNNGREDVAEVLANVVLESKGKVVSKNATFNGKYVTFTLSGSGLEMLKNNGTQTFNIKGDVISLKYDGTIALKLDESSSSAYEQATGFSVNFSEQVNEIETTILASKITVSKAKGAPAGTKTVLQDADPIEALLANIKTDEAIEAEELVLRAVATAAATTTSDQAKFDDISKSFGNIQIFLNNVLMDTIEVGDMMSSSTLATGLYKVDLSSDLKKGDNIVKVMVETKSSAVNGSTIAFSLDSESGTDKALLINPIYVDSDLKVASSSITGTASGATIKVVENGSLAVEALPEPSTKYLPSAEGAIYEVAKFEFEATNDSANIDKLNFDVATTSEHIDTLYLYSNGQLIAQNEVDSNGRAEFKDLSGKFIVKAGSGNTEVLSVRVDLLDLQDGDTSPATSSVKLVGVEYKDSQDRLAPALTVTKLTNTTGNNFVIVKSVPIISKVSLEGDLSTGDLVIASFKVKADKNGRINLAKVNFGLDITGDNITLKDIELLRGSTVLATTTDAVKASTSLNFEISSPSLQRVSAGQEVLLDVVAVIGGVGDSGSITVSLPNAGIVWNDEINLDTSTGITGATLEGLSRSQTWSLSK